MGCTPPFNPRHQRDQAGHDLREEVAEALRRIGECGNLGRIVGEVVAYGGIVDATHPAPSGWVLCDGQSLGRDEYAELFAVVGTSFGGTGATFSVPDLRGRVPIGVGTGAGLTARELGTEYGAEEHDHALTGAGVASHSHSSGTLAGASHTHDEGTYQTLPHGHDAGSLYALMEIESSTIYTYEKAQAWTYNMFGTLSASDNGSGSRSDAVDIEGTSASVQIGITGDSGSTGVSISGNTGTASPALTGNTDNGDSLQPSLGINFIMYTGKDG